MLALACTLAAALHGTPAIRARVLAPLYERAAHAHGIPVSLLSKVCRHESGNRYYVTADGGLSIGLCQVRRNGIDGRRYTRAELLRPDVNADAAAEHLARDLAACGGRTIGALGRYSRGHGCGGNGYGRRVLAEVAAR